MNKSGQIASVIGSIRGPASLFGGLLGFFGLPPLFLTFLFVVRSFGPDAWLFFFFVFVGDIAESPATELSYSSSCARLRPCLGAILMTGYDVVSKAEDDVAEPATSSVLVK